MAKHELEARLDELYAELRLDYVRVRDRVHEDPGTAGDAVEEKWAQVLRGWLPSQYPVVTKGRLIDRKGATSPQVDVIVLRPGYPRRLRESKYLLLDGVAAAFECKLTLRRRDVQEFVRHSVELKLLGDAVTGTPYDELRHPVFYGLLAHSCEIPSKRVEKTLKLRDILEDAVVKYTSHVREVPNVVCVADLICLSSSCQLLFGPDFDDPACGERNEYGKRRRKSGVLSHLYMEHSVPEEATPDRLAEGVVLAGLLNCILHHLGMSDPSARPFAELFFDNRIAGIALGRSMGVTLDSLSGEVLERLRRSGSENESWSRWGRFLS